MMVSKSRLGNLIKHCHAVALRRVDGKYLRYCETIFFFKSICQILDFKYIAVDLIKTGNPRPSLLLNKVIYRRTESLKKHLIFLSLYLMIGVGVVETITHNNSF